MHPIKITLSGGLGNQLFQLSAGIYLEEKLGRKVIYDICNLTTQQKAEVGNYTRKLEIEELILDSPTITRRYSSMIDYPVRFINKIVNSKSVIMERHPNFDVMEQVNDKTKAVYGYFQSASIVNEAWPILESRLKNSLKFASLIGSERVTRIAIHLRFGDYSDDPRTKSVHGLTSTKYFDQAIDAITLKDLNDIPILIVTDNRTRATNFIDGLSALGDVQIISNTNPMDDLAEICRSSHVVTTNSTFSWWGGWIANKVHDSKVVYPRPWFADISDPDLPIYVSYWTGIQRDFFDI